jgi:hypothetical protein
MKTERGKFRHENLREEKFRHENLREEKFRHDCLRNSEGFPVFEQTLEDKQVVQLRLHVRLLFHTSEK